MNLCWIAKWQYFYYLHGMHYTTHAGKSSAIIWKCSMRKKFGQQYTSIKVIAANFQNLARIRKAISVETTYLHAYMFYDYQCGTYIFIYNISRNICKHLFDRMQHYQHCSVPVQENLKKLKLFIFTCLIKWDASNFIANQLYSKLNRQCRKMQARQFRLLNVPVFFN